MLYQAIAAQRWWAEQPTIEVPVQSRDPEASRANFVGERYAAALAMVEPWAKREPRTWAEIASAAEPWLGHEPSRQTVFRWAARRCIVMRPVRNFR